MEAFYSNKDLVHYEVNPLVVTNILSHHQRRGMDITRVYGVLLGKYYAGMSMDDGSQLVRITDSFALQTKIKQEDTMETKVAFSEAQLSRMIQLKRRVNSDEIVVGWYSTNAEDDDITYVSALLNQALSEKAFEDGCPFPCHLTINTNLESKRLKIRCHRGKSYRLPVIDDPFSGDEAKEGEGKALQEKSDEKSGETGEGNEDEDVEVEEVLCRFDEAPLKLVMSVADKIALDVQDPNETNPFMPAAILSDKELTRMQLGNLLVSLVDVKDQAEKIASGDEPPDPLYGFKIASALARTHQLGSADDEWSENRSERVNEMLMLKLLASMTSKQCNVAKYLPGPTK